MSSAVLDASAVLALAHQEQGWQRVQTAVVNGAAISAVNLSEVVAKLAERGAPEQHIRERLGALEIDTVPFDAESAYVTGLLRPATRALGLSLGDRACLALAQRLNLPVLTADRAGAQLQLGVEIQLVR